jgi:uncharacterized protein YutE (UPF0331/DUF86 family)
MMPAKINQRVIAERLTWVDRMVEEIQSLPLGSYDIFMGDSRNVWSAESCLRRSLEALLDMGRHILAKAFGRGVTEYKEIARELGKSGVLQAENSKILEILAGYRNRMVHFYQEVSTKELYKICTEDLKDIVNVRTALADWVDHNQDLVDKTL